MARGRKAVDREPKRKAVKIRLCEREHAGKVTEPHQIMDSIIAKDRKDLDGVKIGIAWHKGWRPDADGVRTHGKVVKRSDLDRSLDGYDAMIIINEQSWGVFKDKPKYRLIAHELEHIQIAKDKNGQPLIDDKGRVVIRMKRHDVADFASIIQTFGLPPCLTDVEIADADRPLLKLAEQKQDSATEATEDTEKEQEGSTAGVAEATGEEDVIDQKPLKFKASGVKLAGVTIFPQCKGRFWRAGYEWKLGNWSEGCHVTEMDWFDGQALCLRNLMASVAIDLAEIEISGKAEQRRAIEARRDTLREQFEDWLQEMIDEAGPSDEGRGTNNDGTVPFEEDPPRQVA